MRDRRIDGRAIVSRVKSLANEQATDLVLILIIAGGFLALSWDEIGSLLERHGVGDAPADALSALAVALAFGLSIHLGWRIVARGRLLRLTAGERTLLKAMPRALADGELLPFFQPVFDTRSGTVAGAEALARWRLPDGSFLSPGAFIPLAEKTGMIRTLTERISSASLAAAAQWIRDGRRIPVSINLTAADFDDPAFLGRLMDMSASHGVPPEMLRVELTESQSIRSFDTAQSSIRWLRERGVAVYLDDFGTGYASLSLLHQIPFSGIKLDQSYVRALLDDTAADAIVRAAVGVARELGLDVVAEGVETQPVADRLSALGVTRQQGFLYSRAVPAQQLAELARWAERETGREAPEAARAPARSDPWAGAVRLLAGTA